MPDKGVKPNRSRHSHETPAGLGGVALSGGLLIARGYPATRVALFEISLAVAHGAFCPSLRRFLIWPLIVLTSVALKSLPSREIPVILCRSDVRQN